MTRDRTREPAEPGVVRRSADIEPVEIAAGSATTMQLLLGPEDGAPHFAVRRFIMGPGGGMPRHTNSVEHEQFVLRGRARVGLGDRVHEVGPEDVLYIPAGVAHFYEVVEAPFEFLCVVPNAPDEIRILDR
jgi:quercetin dioxygenase-like cupin family protein